MANTQKKLKTGGIMKVKYGKKSLERLTCVDPRLTYFAMTLEKVDMPCDLSVFETKRTKEQQTINVQKGVSKTMNSNHIPNSKGIVNAMDLVPYLPGKGNVWDEKLYRQMLPIWKKIRTELGLDGILEFGADWKSFVDYPHLEVKKEHRL